MTRRRGASVGRATRRLDDVARWGMRQNQPGSCRPAARPSSCPLGTSHLITSKSAEMKGIEMQIPRRIVSTALPATLLVFISSLTSGCATIPSASLGSAAALAQAGQAAAGQMEQNVTISGQTLILFRKAAAFNDAFNGSTGASKKAVSEVEAIQKNLAQYGNLLHSLAAAYSAMDELAEYGASPTFDSAVSGLVSDAQTFGKQTGSKFAVPASVTTGIEEGGNVVVGAIQTEKVIKASEQIDAMLQKVITVLSDKKVRSAMLPIQAELQGLVDQTAFSIYTQGVYSYRPIVDAFGAPLGLQSVPDVDAIVRSKSGAKLRAGLSAVVSQTVDSQVAAAEAAYDQGLNALKALQEQHQALQAKKPVTLDNVINLVSQLKVLAQVASPQTPGESK